MKLGLSPATSPIHPSDAVVKGGKKPAIAVQCSGTQVGSGIGRVGLGFAKVTAARGATTSIMQEGKEDDLDFPVGTDDSWESTHL